jgi:hypothetical protein
MYELMRKGEKRAHGKNHNKTKNKNKNTQEGETKKDSV